MNTSYFFSNKLNKRTKTNINFDIYSKEYKEYLAEYNNL